MPPATAPLRSNMIIVLYLNFDIKHLHIMTAILHIMTALVIMKTVVIIRYQKLYE